MYKRLRSVVCVTEYLRIEAEYGISEIFADVGIIVPT